MAREDRGSSDPHDPTASRLDDLERRLEMAFRKLEGRGDAAARREGESLRARRARLHEQVRGGAGGAGVLGEIESLTDAVDRWVTHVDQSQAQHTQRTIR